ncbi:acyl-ACP--UDP-N- acetylglucosamine O-acyltransferase [Leucobacter weissii]|uniref:Acyl-ACP--UDP-N- acetylglucosamine O-acyltransferase n=1 Tax=Leucobacter weissii TaxID=1983706 RepID=A0A939MH78_9MICO|nr:acyl-ACP--UDP-N- acetylglucosamine O-acyltransferase [Leucobacter weissii]MBO1900571.1 acyl-ACP--UDP-N- acetylglucosamine O-acyltransferase [Leucobacter weissii]
MAEPTTAEPHDGTGPGRGAPGGDQGGCRISPHAVIGAGVELGARVRIGPGAVLLGPCVVEDDVFIGAGAQLGAPPELSDRPQNAAWEDRDGRPGDLLHAGVRVETGAVIREGAVIHQGSHRPTTVGAGAWILNRAYLAHDVRLGPGATVSAGVSIGGHCVIGARANLGLNAAIHQRVFVGAGSMVGMGTPLARDLPPHVTAYGSPARIHGVNAVGLRRQGIDEAEIAALRDAYEAGDLLLERADPGRWSGSLAEDLAQWREREDRRPAAAARP